MTHFASRRGLTGNRKRCTVAPALAMSTGAVATSTLSLTSSGFDSKVTSDAAAEANIGTVKPQRPGDAEGWTPTKQDAAFSNGGCNMAHRNLVCALYTHRFANNQHQTGCGVVAI